MKTILASESIPIPKNVQIWIKARVVRVTGPRGTLTRNFKHAQVQMEIIGKKNRTLKVSKWFGKKKQIAVVRSICSHVNNMIKGVTKGFKYKMRFVYAHFPLNCNIPSNGSSIEIHNFLGEKVVRRVQMLEGVTISRTADVKDEIVLVGNDIEKVSLSAATIHQKTLVRKKDIRKFLDGVYVSEKGTIED